MLKKEPQNIHALFFALIALLCGAVGLTFEDAAAQDAEMCKFTSVVTMTAADREANQVEGSCEKFGGTLEDGGEEKKGLLRNGRQRHFLHYGVR